MIETKVFEDINKLYPIEGMTDDDELVASPAVNGQSRSKKWFTKIFKTKRQVRLHI